MASSTSEFRIRPRGPFSLARAVAFGFGPTFGTAPDPRPMMRLAFCLDGYGELAGVVLTEEKGVVVGRVSGESAVDTVKDQVARVLSLDFDGRGWEEVGARDPVIGELQAEFSGFRPVLFHSPYEAAAWAIIATRKPNAQARKIRETIARTLGQVFDLEGESVAAFPTPERLAALDSVPGGDTVRAERLRGVARAALEGVLHPQTLRDLGVERARQQVKTIPGIGDFYAGLIAHRAVGFPDALNENDESSWRCVAHFYRRREPTAEDFVALAEPWRPFRNWAIVLLRQAGYRAGITKH